jgi:hypothetical protein
MTPGASHVFRPGLTIVLGILGVGAGALLYPSGYYEQFVRAVAACVSIGLTQAVVVSAVAFVIVRRGAFPRRREMTSMIGFLGGLSSIVILYVFCPHRDLWHFSLAHTTVPVATAVVGGWIGHRATLVRPTRPLLR